MKVVKVSVAMATYNGSRFLREQLESLYAQTRLPDEIVVVDDCSTDGTHDILEEYHQKKGLIYFVNKANLGVNKNFEKAIRNCTGDYIAICDQDDVWMSHKLQTCLSKILEIEGNKPACVSSQCIEVNKELKIIEPRKSKMIDSFGLKPNLLTIHNSQGCTMMINRELVNLLGSFPSKGLMYDGYIGLLAPCIGYKYNIAEPLMFYRHHDANVIGKIRKNVPLMTRIINHLKIWKYDIPFYYGRFDSLRLLKEMHESDMTTEAIDLINDLLDFHKSGLYGKIIYIMKEDFFSKKSKIQMASKLVITSFLPIKPLLR